MNMRVFRRTMTPSSITGCCGGHTHFTVHNPGTPDETLAGSTPCDGSCVPTTFDVPEGKKGESFREKSAENIKNLLKLFTRGQLAFKVNGKDAAGDIDFTTVTGSLCEVRFSQVICFEPPGKQEEDGPVVTGTWIKIDKEFLNFKVELLVIKPQPDRKPTDNIEATLLRENGEKLMDLFFVNPKSGWRKNLSAFIGRDLPLRY